MSFVIFVNHVTCLFIFHLQETKDEDLEKLVQAHCRLDLTAPMPGCTANHQRNLLFEGDLKLKEGTNFKVTNIFIKVAKPEVTFRITWSRWHGSVSVTFTSVSNLIWALFDKMWPKKARYIGESSFFRWTSTRSCSATCSSCARS